MMISQGKQRAVLFADISGSSALYKDKGNNQAQTIISGLLDQVQKIVNEHQGRVIKTIGDEVMVSFACGGASMEAAISIQKNFIAMASQHQALVNIGISFGEVIIEQGDVFGETVNDAAYLTKLAKGGQILFSAALLEQLTAEQKNNAREFDRVTLKGAKEPSSIFRLYWQQESGTHNETQYLSADITLGDITRQILVLHYEEQEIVIAPNMTPFLMGRNLSSCQLVSDDSQVSREHCHIKYNRGKFVLVDHSTNGCYLKPANGVEFYLRREEYPLLGNSLLSLGVPIEQASNPVLIETQIPV